MRRSCQYLTTQALAFTATAGRESSPGPHCGDAGAGLHDKLAKHIAYLINGAYSQVGRDRKPVLQPTAEAEKSYGDKITSMMLVFSPVQSCTPSLSNGEGELERLRKSLPPEAKAKVARLGIWGCGIDDYMAVLEEWRAEGKFSTAWTFD